MLPRADRARCKTTSADCRDGLGALSFAPRFSTLPEATRLVLELVHHDVLRLRAEELPRAEGQKEVRRRTQLELGSRCSAAVLEGAQAFEMLVRRVRPSNSLACLAASRDASGCWVWRRLWRCDVLTALGNKCSRASL